MKTWATYWSGPTAADADGRPVEHIASEQFHEAGVEVGDRMYVISYRQGRLHVVTSIVVGELVSQGRAEASLDRDDLWDARWHVVARPESVGRATMSAVLSERQVDAMVFIGRDGEAAKPARNRHGRVDPQTFRTTRQVDATTAAVLQKVLAKSR